MHSYDGYSYGGHDGHTAGRLRRLEDELMMLRSSQRPNSSGNGRRLDRLEQQLDRLNNSTPTQLSPIQPPPPPPHQIVPMPMPMPMPMPHPMMQGGMNDSSMSTSGVSSKAHEQLLVAHKELLEQMKQDRQAHSDLMKAHKELIALHKATVSAMAGGGGATGKKAIKAKAKHPMLGVIRLDYNYPPAAGDIDCPGSYGYDVLFRVVPGLTFGMAQDGKFTEEVEREFAAAVKWLEMKGASAITGDCGFMMAFQVTARKIASRPVFMSSMCQCPIIAAAYEKSDHILILTANSQTLKPQKDVLLNSCGFDVNEDRFKIVGCQDVPGFDAVAKGEKVDVERVTPGVVKLTKQTLERQPAIKAILLECTELPPYSDAIRAATGLPVWDAITGADFYISAYKDNPRFGIDDWQAEWDQEQDEYEYGQNLREDQKAILVNKVEASKPAPKKKATKRQAEKILKNLKKKQNPVLGVVRLDYNYPPADGDVDSPASYGYEVLYRTVPGLTFEMAQSGKMTPQVQRDFEHTCRWLERKGASGLIGDCGFMMAFQIIARRAVDRIPVFMSSMMQIPMMAVAFDKYDKVLIMTANDATLKPQKQYLLEHCGFDVDDDRFIICGAQDVKGFDAVAKGDKVDVELVTPGMVELVQRILRKRPMIKGIILECTEMPPYTDALRQATGLPVFDSITCADFFINAYMDNPRFGLNDWQSHFSGNQKDYKLGDNLDAAERQRLQFA